MSAEAIRIGTRRPVRRLFVHQIRSEQLVFWRSREAAFFIFLFPLLLFVLLGSVYSGKFERVPVAWAVLAALLTSTLVVFGLQTVALFLLGRSLYSTSFPSDIGSFVVTIVIGAAVFAA